MPNLFRATNQAQIHEILIRSFVSMTRGQKIPSEPTLAKMYHVSRSTIREVLKQLEFEGYLIRKKGSGTYLLKPPISEQENLLYFFDIKTMIEAKGAAATCDPVKIVRCKAGPFFSRTLGIANHEEIIRRYLLFRANGSFAVLLEDCFPAVLLSSEGDYNELYDTAADLRMMFFKSTGRLANKDELLLSTADREQLQQLEFFDIPKDKALLHMQSVCFDESNCPIMCSRFFSDTSYIDYKINRHLLLK